MLQLLVFSFSFTLEIRLGRKNKAEKDYALVAKDASSFAMRISWLKNEPKVSFFPVI